MSHSILNLFGNGRNMNGRIGSKSEMYGRIGVTSQKKSPPYGRHLTKILVSILDFVFSGK